MTSRTLFRSEAVALKQSLEIGSPLYSELEHALLVQNGLTTLSNGRKIYSKRAEDKLPGGMIAPDNCDTTIAELFDEVISTASDLHLVTKSEALKNCSLIRRSIGYLATITQLKVDNIELQQEKGEGQFISAVRRQVECGEIIKNKNNKLNTLGIQLGELKSERQETCREISRIEKEFHSLPHPPSCAGGSREMTPEIEAIDRRLNREKKRLEQVDTKLSNVRGIISQTMATISRMENEIQACDQKIKNLGVIVTQIKNIVSSLKNLIINYKFLDAKVELVKEAIEFDLDEKLVNDFLYDVRNVQKSFRAVSLALTLQEN